MKHLLGICLTAALLLIFAPAWASFHTFVIDEAYSNADGSVQFIVLHEAFGLTGQEFLGPHTLQSTGSGGPKTFPFTSNLPSSATAGKRVLIATAGFAALGIVTPDYMIPNGFLSLTSGTVNYAESTNIFAYSALPTDGVNALYRSGVAPNLATNFAGQSAPVQPSVSPQLGNWSNPSEQGTGYAMDFKHGVLVVVFFSFEANGQPQWYIASGPLSGNTFTGTLDKFVNGQCISASCPYKFPTAAGNDGAVTIDFSSNTSGTMHLPGGRTIPITPTVF